VPPPQGLTDAMISMNVTSTTKMTQFVLPGMVMRKRGAIINVRDASTIPPRSRGCAAFRLCGVSPAVSPAVYVLVADL